jgi:hypothetical protein
VDDFGHPRRGRDGRRLVVVRTPATAAGEGRTADEGARDDGDTAHGANLSQLSRHHRGDALGSDPGARHRLSGPAGRGGWGGRRAGCDAVLRRRQRLPGGAGPGDGSTRSLDRELELLAGHPDPQADPGASGLGLSRRIRPGQQHQPAKRGGPGDRQRVAACGGAEPVADRDPRAIRRPHQPQPGVRRQPDQCRRDYAQHARPARSDLRHVQPGGIGAGKDQSGSGPGGRSRPPSPLAAVR